MKPCIIKGDTKNWKCMNKWNDLYYFLNEYGNRLVPIEIGHNQLYSSKKTSKSDSNWNEKIMTIKEFIENYMVPSSKDSQSINTESDKVGYLAQHNLIEQLPNLSSDFAKPSCQPESSEISPHVWFGTGNTITPIHYDSYDNFLTQIVGYKYVRLYSPSMSKYLYVEKENENDHSTTAQNNMSLVDIDHPDLERFPLFSKAEYVEYILGPGDMLFIPNHWWHYVRSLSPSFSLSFWFTKD
eukprot:gene5085-6329_t